MASYPLTDMTAAEWLRHASHFVGEAEAEALKSKVSATFRARAEQARRQVELIEDELAALGEAPRLDTSDSEGKQRGDLGALSAKKLVHLYAGRCPGSRAADFAKFLTKHKGASAAKQVHTLLYQESKAGGALVKKGAKPDTQYYLADQDNGQPPPASGRKE